MTAGRATVGIVAVGSTGDVLPHLGVAMSLADEGHDVIFATHESHRRRVTSLGLAFHSLPMEPQDELTEERAARMRRSPREAAAAVGEAFLPWVRPLAFAIDDFTSGCDLVLLTTLAWPGIHSAAAQGIPSISLHLQPLEPTREFPPAVLTGRRLPRVANRVMAQQVQRLMLRPHMAVVNEIRRSHGLATMTAREHVQWLAASNHPGLHGWSPAVARRPADWRRELQVVGYWWPPSSEWSPPARLADFLSSGSPPVHIGFGSASPAPPEVLARVVRDAVQESGTRAVVVGGWAGLGDQPEFESDDVLVIDWAPHEWLFPRVSAVVHHAGCGTTAAALRAGVPSVPVPVALDQPFWAHRAHALGVATRPISPRELTGRALGDALRFAVRDRGMTARARELAGVISAENGTGAVVQAVRAQLTSQERRRV
jgi:UDP:flavonoid glycosyltransferase YjiC (YdhE family)